MIDQSSTSSTRKTLMSTPPKHPLPPRPDWAAGIKAQPTLHTTARHRHDSNNSKTASPAKPHQNLHQHQNHPHSAPHHQQRPQPVSLHSSDFPPLSGVAGPGRPITGGVWGGAVVDANTRQPSAPGRLQGGGGNALYNHGSANRLEDEEQSFQRPPP